MSRPAPSITVLLAAIRRGDEQAWSRLVPLVYDELRGLARWRLSRLSARDTLRTTDLVHESYLRLMAREVDWESRRHFFAAASWAMRDILVEAARRQGREKRGGGWRRVELVEGIPGGDERSTDLVELDEALRRLEAEDELQHIIVMLRYFAGLAIDDVARLLEVSPSTVDRNWRFARAWLHRELSGS